MTLFLRYVHQNNCRRPSSVILQFITCYLLKPQHDLVFMATLAEPYDCYWQGFCWQNADVLFPLACLRQQIHSAAVCVSSVQAHTSAVSHRRNCDLKHAFTLPVYFFNNMHVKTRFLHKKMALNKYIYLILHPKRSRVCCYLDGQTDVHTHQSAES